MSENANFVVAMGSYTPMGRMRSIVSAACLVFGWACLQLSGHVVLCHGQDGHVAVELTFHAHCDGHDLADDPEATIQGVPMLLPSAGCQDTPILPETADHDGMSPSRWPALRVALDSRKGLPALCAPVDIRRPRRFPPPHCLSHLRTVVLLV